MAAQPTASGMNPWTRINILLGLLAAGLSVVVLWPAGTSDTVELTTLEPDQISQIRIERADRLTLALERSALGWQITYPTGRPAVGPRVEQLLAVARAPVAQRFAAGERLAEYGLDRPAAVLQLDELRLAFGDRDPVQRSRYVLLDDEVRVVDDVYYNLLTLPVQHFSAD